MSKATHTKLGKMAEDTASIMDALQMSIESLNCRIDDLEDKQAKRETEVRAAKIDELDEKRGMLDVQYEALQGAKDVIEEARENFDPEA